MNWIYYLLEANLYVVVFYLFYQVMLRRETFYQFNRAYLLTTCSISFIIPLLQIGILKKSPEPAYHIVPAIVVVNSPDFKAGSAANVVQGWSSDDYYLMIYGAIVIALIINLSVKIFKLYRLTRRANKTKERSFYLVETDENNAFSFLRYLFINPKLSDTSTIVRHELVHIRQKHSLDIIFLEFFKIINWFNPVAYLVLGNVKELHEFIADRETISPQADVNFYADFLLQRAYNCPRNALTNNFSNKNLLKKRIMMLYQKPSGKLARLKYLVIVPLCLSLLCVSTIGFSKSYGWIDLIPNKTALFREAADSNAIAAKATKMKFPPPNVIKTAYSGLSEHISSTMKYPEKAKNAHYSGMVIVSFKLGKDKMMSNVAVVKGAGHGFDEAAVKALQSYQQPINDKAGTYKMGVGFYSFYTSKQIAVSKQMMNEPDFVGNLLIVDEIPKQFPASPASKKTPPPPPASPKPAKLTTKADVQSSFLSRI